MTNLIVPVRRFLPERKQPGIFMTQDCPLCYSNIEHTIGRRRMLIEKGIGVVDGNGVMFSYNFARFIEACEKNLPISKDEPSHAVQCSQFSRVMQGLVNRTQVRRYSDRFSWIDAFKAFDREHNSDCQCSLCDTDLTLRKSQIRQDGQTVFFRDCSFPLTRRKSEIFAAVDKHYPNFLKIDEAINHYRSQINTLARQSVKSQVAEINKAMMLIVKDFRFIASRSHGSKYGHQLILPFSPAEDPDSLPDYARL